MEKAHRRVSPGRRRGADLRDDQLQLALLELVPDLR